MIETARTKTARLLLDWYDASGRDLPWRRTNDAYEILVSEIMLQQTQVPRVVPAYRRWLEAFPDWQALARAGTAEVIRAWAGLGYNRRALALQEIARQVVEHGLPDSEEDWLRLKGIGPYTAAAMTVFSLKKLAVPIDTNIRRAGARLLLGEPFPEPRDDGKLRPRLAEVLRGSRRFDDLVQALFDLASLVCLKKPLCATCPLGRECPACAGFLEGTHAAPDRTYPASRERKHRNKPHPDRIFRGRILSLVREAPTGLAVADLGPRIDPSFEPANDRAWLDAMIGRLVADGLVMRSGNRLKLPS
ncbi:MAG TPA: A/G-specific adenine glycosylase [Candidatus Ozemobacteraceae bacterium]|nr:A/G-specific adenine glycosylase [Candidatus Ozemobacteraceae bacterium]